MKENRDTAFLLEKLGHLVTSFITKRIPSEYDIYRYRGFDSFQQFLYNERKTEILLVKSWSNIPCYSYEFWIFKPETILFIKFTVIRDSYA